MDFEPCGRFPLFSGLSAVLMSGVGPWCQVRWIKVCLNKMCEEQDLPQESFYTDSKNFCFGGSTVSQGVMLVWFYDTMCVFLCLSDKLRTYTFVCSRWIVTFYHRESPVNDPLGNIFPSTLGKSKCTRHTYVVVLKFIFFTPWGIDPIWQTHFSNGLKPPPRFKGIKQQPP